MTYELLKNAPAQDSPEFIEYLRKNNVVIKETDNFILIQNCKYHSPEKPWYTLFTKKKSYPAVELLSILYDYFEWEWLKKSKEKQTVPGRFHIHLYKTK